MSKPKCLHCKASLRLIGRERLNGKDSFKDWDSRRYHKACYKIIKENERFRLFLNL